MMMLHQQILQKLDEKSFPDLSFFLQDEVLDEATPVLEELLEKEKKEFQDLLEKENTQLTFHDLQEDSLLDYFWSILDHFENVQSSEKLRNIIETFRPKLQDFGNEVAYSKSYFEKLVYMQDYLELDSDQKRILEISIKAYKDRGIDLPEQEQEEIKKLNKRLGELTDTFSNNVVDDKGLFSYEITDFAVIKDLPKEVLANAKKAGSIPPLNLPLSKGEKTDIPEGQGEVERYIFDANPTSTQAIMKYCSDPKIRKDFQKFGYSIASAGKYDNRGIVLEILTLRDKKAKILGYKNFAEMSLNSKMADSPEQIFELIGGISKKAKLKAKTELEELQQYFQLEKLETFDIAYYSRKLKEEKYSVNEEEIKEYFELENVLAYMFSFVETFYDIKIQQIKVDSYTDDVRIYEVYKNGELISYYFQDLFYRKEKRPGAWNSYFTLGSFVPEKRLPVVLNVCDFFKNMEGKTTLYLRDVEALFHEFGHALHTMLLESKYSDLTGFGVEWDFVELPSQLMENWVKERESIVKFAKHVDTGEIIPSHLLDKLQSLNTFMGGNFIVGQSTFVMLDMNIYSQEVPKSIEELDKKTLEYVNEYGLFQREEDYKMYASFRHIFSGGYAAGYYSYMWAELLEADVFARIKEMRMFSPETGEKLLSTIIGQGCRKKASELFVDFMGRELSNEAFMKRYGL